MRTFRRLVALALSAITTVAAQAQSPARHMLFAVHGPHATVYILGSVHLLTPDASALPAAVDTAFSRATRVVFETNIDTLQAHAMELAMRGRLPQGTTLREVVDSNTYAKLDSVLPSYGLSSAQVAGLKPWMVSLLLSQMTMMRAGYQPQLGVDMQIATRAHGASKPIGGLESADFQLGLFDTISPDDQIALLDEALVPPDSGIAKMAHLRDAWLRADMRVIDSITTSDFGGHPGLLAAMLTDRTRRWVPQVEQMLHGSTDVLVVVGAGHLVGKKGLIALLEAKGYTIHQL